MANRYWVGGAAAWDGTAGTKWALTSGGAGGQAVPTTTDDVFFDAASGAVAVTIGATANCQNLDFSGFTGTFSAATGQTLNVYGNFTASTGMTYTATNISINFRSTTTGKTITSNGKSIGRVITFNGVGGGWTLQDALTNNGGSAGDTGSGVFLTNGTFNTNGYTVTVNGPSNLECTFSITGTNTRTLTLGSSNIVINNLASNRTSTFDATTTTNLTFNANTSTISFPGTYGQLIGGGLTYNNVTSSCTAKFTVSGSNTIANLTIGARATVGVGSIDIGGNQTITGTFTCTAGTNVTYRNFVNSDVLGTTRTLTCAAVSLTDVDFQDITIAGAAAPASGTRLGDCQGNSGITFPAAKTVYWNLSGAQNWSATGWATSSGGSPSVNNFPLAQDTAVFDNTGSVTGTITINAAWNIGTLDMSARTSAMTLSSSGSATIYGNWTNGSGTTISGTSQTTFAGRGAQSITSAAKTFTQGITIDSPSGTVTLQDALTTSRAAAGAVTLTNGTLDLNGKTLTLSATATATFLTAAGTKNLTFNGGSLVVAASGTAFNNTASSGFTTTAGTGTGTISLTSASAKTFAGGGATFNCTLNQGGAGALTITGANTFNNITNTYSATGATTITFTAGTTTTVSSFTATGASGAVLTLNSATSGTQATIALTGGGAVTTSDYLNVKDLSFTPFVTNGTAPYSWYAGANSTNSGNNSGILFTAPTVKAYLITSGTSWTVPPDWNNSSNNIYLIGGGGGGGGSRVTSSTNKAGGGGGGGGGFTALTNQTLSSPVAYSVGAGGTAGTSSGGTGGTGGTTTFNAQTATGGGGGSTTTTPSSVGGSGGTGTFTGGTGGAGATTTTSGVAVAGGGGAGSGGPNGNGGNGGIGFANATAANVAGGGGGGNGGGSAGGNASSGVGGTGGNNFGGTGGGASGTAGTLGGGGGGGVNAAGALGGAGIDVSNTVGGGGGAGGSGSGSGSTSTAYGAGGGGGATNTGTTTSSGGAGGQGMIFIIYTPGGGAVTSGNFFFMF